MVAYNFKPRFVPAIEAGTKDQTIRNRRTGRSQHARPGQTVHCYTGLRQPSARLILAAPCALLADIRIDLPSVRFPGWVLVTLGDDLLEEYGGLACDQFAQRDGFADFDDMARFWQDVHEVKEFSGNLIRWQTTRRQAEKAPG